MSVTNDEFKNALKLWASGVTVVTAMGEDGLLKGMTATSFSSVSMDPPQILVCINQTADTGEAVFSSETFTVSVLTTEQETVSNQFAGGASQQERFDNVDWVEGEGGSAVIENALVSLECRLVDKVLAGSHWVVIGEVVKTHVGSGEPLLYFNSAYRAIK